MGGCMSASSGSLSSVVTSEDRQSAPVVIRVQSGSSGAGRKSKSGGRSSASSSGVGGGVSAGPPPEDNQQAGSTTANTATPAQQPQAALQKRKEEKMSAVHECECEVEPTTRLQASNSSAISASSFSALNHLATKTSSMTHASSANSLTDSVAYSATTTANSIRSTTLPLHHSAPMPASSAARSAFATATTTTSSDSQPNSSPVGAYRTCASLSAHNAPVLSPAPHRIVDDRPQSMQVPHGGLPQSRSVPVNLSSLLQPSHSPSRSTIVTNGSGLRPIGGSASNLHALALAPTVHTDHIESGLTEDGFFHINQYLVEMGRWKREAMRRREAKARRIAERVEARLKRQREGGLTLDESDEEEEDDGEADEEESPDVAEEDDDDQPTILGRGSYGVVKKVFNTQDGMFYAMKIMSRSLLRKTRDGIDAVRREVAIMKKLSNPNVVKLVEVLYDANDEDDNVYLVMEYAENGPVMSVDPDECEVEFEDGTVNIITEPLPVEVARQCFRDTLTGLDYLHHQGVIHRDIKPENLLVDRFGNVKITDFGVSQLCEGEDFIVASTAGTGVFLAPECILSGSRSGAGFNGAQADVFSLGATLYFMLYGRLPWYAKSVPEIYRQIVEEPLVFPTGLEWAHIPVQAQALISRMLEKDPKVRTTVSQMLRCPWITAEGTWAVEQHYKSQPLVGDTLCSREIQAAVCDTKIKKEMSLSKLPADVTPAADAAAADPAVPAPHTDHTLLAKMKSRLTAWKRDLKRKCDMKKAARAQKRASLQAKLSLADASTRDQVIPPTDAEHTRRTSANAYAAN